MPSADEQLQDEALLRCFLYGPPKSRKTWWAAAAAEAGFRVLFISLERGHTILQQLTPAARKRIYIIDAHDGPRDAYSCGFMGALLNNYQFYCNEATRSVSLRPFQGARSYDLTGFGAETVLVLDTYTALAVSASREFAKENNIDLSEADKQDWPGYGWCGRWLTWMLVQLRALPCNVVVIGHSINYEKYKKHPTDPKKQGPLEWTRRQPVSSSNPHGMTVTRDFDHTLYMYIEGRSTYLDTRGSQYEDAGSRTLPPDRYRWEDMSFGQLATLRGIPLPKDVAPFEFPQFVQPALVGKSAQPPQPAALNPGTTPALTFFTTRSVIAAKPRSSFIKL